MTKTKMTLKNSIFQQDCVEFLRSLDEGSVDLVFSDPPYNVKKDYGVYKDNRPPEEYIRWMDEIIQECRRVSRRGVLMYVSSKLNKVFFDLMPSAHLIPIHKRAAGVVSGNYMLQYHSLFSEARPIKKVKDLWDDVRLPGEGYFFREKRYPNPGLTSELLTDKILAHWTLEGETVLDPFMGVGTTAVSCKKAGRNFIGTELNLKYIEIAYQRLEEVENTETPDEDST